MSMFDFTGEQQTQAQMSAKPLISQSTILILSGFLIGSVFRDYAEPRLERNVLFAGLVGIVAYIGLVFGAYRHGVRKRREVVERKTAELENRIVRCISESPQAAAAEPAAAGKGAVADSPNRLRSAVGAAEPALAGDSAG